MGMQYMFVERMIHKMNNADLVVGRVRSPLPSASGLASSLMSPLSLPCLCSSRLHLPAELRIKRQNSSDSISSLNSITSHSSVGSGKDADAKKKKKKSWVGTGFGAGSSEDHGGPPPPWHRDQTPLELTKRQSLLMLSVG